MRLENNFFCSDNLRPHLKLIFDGEYDIPYNNVGMKILDVGANVGAFSIWASYRWPISQVYAYEPSVENFELLKLNTRNFHNISAHNHAIGTPGLRVLYKGKHNEGEHSLFKDNGGVTSIGYHVDCFSPISLPHADILKIDTEGCEIEILYPLIKDKRSFKAIMLEFHCESHRRDIDLLLSDYVLIGANINSPDLGVVKYINRDLL